MALLRSASSALAASTHVRAGSFASLPSAQSRSRPFALPTLVASALWAWCGAVRFRKPDYFWTYYFLSFVFAAIVFGTFAIAVKWLQEQRDRQAEHVPMLKRS